MLLKENCLVPWVAVVPWNIGFVFYVSLLLKYEAEKQKHMFNRELNTNNLFIYFPPLAVLGSSSMATVCGGSLALMDAGIYFIIFYMVLSMQNTRA